MKDVMILTGAGQIGMAIARRMGYGKKIVVGDKKLESRFVRDCRTIGGSWKSYQERWRWCDDFQSVRLAYACPECRGR